MSYSTWLILYLLLWSTGCGTLALQQGSAPDTSGMSTVSIRPVGAIVQIGLGCLKSVEEFKIQTADILQHAQFLNQANGWISSRRSLFMTNDGGKTWEKLRLSLPKDGRIGSFFFVSQQNGWVAIVREMSSEQNGVSYASRLSVTSDGGKTWTERNHFGQEVEVEVLRFLNTKVGFAAGLRMVQTRVSYPEMFLARTENGGTTWGDVSSEAKRAITGAAGSSNDHVVDVISTSQGYVSVLTAFGRIITSSDSGKSWRQLNQFLDERPQTGYQKLVLYDERLAVLSGTISQEGIWGDLILQDTREGWTTYEINNLALFDLEFLSRDLIVAAGGAFTGYGKSSSEYNGRLLPGVILRSTDGGKTWLEIYRSKSNLPIIDVIAVGANQLYAIGNEGTFLKLEMQTCGASNSAAAMP